jgi:uncharacterized membrane protein YfcA
MLPFDRKPWAKAVAATVITLSFIGAICLAFYFHSIDSLHPPEIVGLFLLLLTIVPPNFAVLMRKPGEEDPLPQTHLRHTR